MKKPDALAFVFLAALCAAPARARVREKTLLSDFESGKAEDRVRLAPALGRMRDKKATDALLAAFDVRRSSPRETAAIIGALGLSGDTRAVTELASSDDYLRSAALQAGELPAPLQSLREKTMETLGRLGGDQAVAILEEAVNDKDPRVVEEAVRGHGRLQVKDSIPALRQLATQGGDMTRTVFEAFASIGDRRAEPALEQGLMSQDRLVNVEAAYALAKLGHKGMTSRLEAALADDSDPKRVAILAAYYLAKMDRVAGLDRLVDFMKKGNSDFPILAADALGRTENPRAVLPLIEALKTDDSALRLSIARSLGLLGGVRAVSVLKKLRGDPNPSVQAAAAALAQLGEAE